MFGRLSAPTIEMNLEFSELYKKEKKHIKLINSKLWFLLKIRKFMVKGRDQPYYLK